MSFTLLASLVVAISSTFLLRLKYGPKWYLLPFGMLTVMALIYHWASEVVIRLTGADQWSPSRPAREWAEIGAFYASLSLLVMTMGYLLGNNRRQGPVDLNIMSVRRDFDWRLLLLALVPLAATTVSGKGYASGKPLGPEDSFLTGLAYQLYVPLAILAAVACIARWPRYLIPVVVSLSVLMAIAGQRLEILLTLAVALAVATRLGMRLQPSKIVVLGIAAALLVVGLGGVRAAGERGIFQSDSGIGERLSALSDAIVDPQLEAGPMGAGSSGAEAALRLDANDWAGNLAYSMSDSSSGTGLGPVLGAIGGQLPSAIYSGKLSTPVEDRDPEAAAIAYLSIPAVDYLPGHVTFLMGSFSVPIFLVIMFAIGCLLGVIEARVVASDQALALLGYVVLAVSALFFERGLIGYVNGARTFLLLAPLLLLMKRVRPRRRAAPVPLPSVSSAVDSPGSVDLDVRQRGPGGC